MLQKSEVQAWFFDLGGTLLQVEEDEIALTGDGNVIPLPGTIAALSRLRGRKIFIVSNQASVGLGKLSAMQAYDFVRQVNMLCGGAVTDFRFAMHRPAVGHAWRKPSPGMILDLAAVYELDLPSCAMVGDSSNDEACARNAGIGRFYWIDDFLAGNLG